MNLKNAALAFALVAGLSAGLTSCKSQEKKDAEAKAKIEAAAPGVTVTVKDGVATLSGEMANDADKAAAEAAAQKVEGIKSVVNQTTVTPPPAPVVINPDQVLIDAANTVAKNFAGVTAAVKDGIVTLTGEIKKAELQKLMAAINAIHPKKVENKLVIK